MNNKNSNKQKKTRAGKLVRQVARAVVTQSLPRVGSALAQRVGLPASMGRSAGDALAARLSRIIGGGDYEASNAPVCNSLFKGSRDIGSPTFGSAAIRLRFREYLGEVYNGPTAGGFNASSYPINPGLRSSFPYLGQIACNYEQYHVHGLVYEFVSSVSPYSATSNMGTVVMTHMSNPDRSTYGSKFEMENSENAVSARVDKSIVYGIECEGFRTEGLAVRENTVPGTLLPYDHGTLVVATQSPLAPSAVLGELWVTYDVSLSHPRISPVGFGYAHLQLAFVDTGGTTMCNASATVKADTLRAGVSWVPGSTAGIIKFAGTNSGEYYLIQVLFKPSGRAGNSVVNYLYSNCDLINFFHGANPQSLCLDNLGGISLSFIIRANNPAVQPFISLATTTSTGTSTGLGDIIVTHLGSDLPL